jgi:DNA invertase Pin-like site-specific DNA recombinase
VPLAFSYIRFSSAKQELGDSLRRQLKLAEDYAESEGLTLDTHSYRDLGVSAFKGKNLTEGKLATFVSAVASGKIPKGSYLLVESFDRISRDDADEALELFLKITKLGITLVTLQDKRVYTKESRRKDPIGSLVGPLVLMVRAHEESQTKSGRVGAKWEEKRGQAAAGGLKMTAVAPSWLRLSDDRKRWTTDVAKAKVVERIFDLALTGYGTPTIARLLNAEGVPTMARAKCWTFGVVNAILKNESVIGTYTPKKVAKDRHAEPIMGYYPAIISETKFFQVKEHLKGRKWVGGQNKSQVRNLFAGISYCYGCGARMRVKSTASAGGKTYLQCQTAYSGGNCDQPIFPYYAAERAMMDDFAEAIAELIEQSREPNPADPRFVLASRRADLQRKIDTLLDAMEELDGPQLRSRIAARQAELSKVDQELRETVSPTATLAGNLEAVALIQRLKQIKTLTAEERLQAQTMFKRLLTAVHFDATDTTIILQWMSYEWEVDAKPYLDKVGGARRRSKVGA